MNEFVGMNDGLADRRPSWKRGSEPTMFGALLASLPGVDHDLLREAPADERAQIRNIGMAMLAGTSFQALTIGASLALSFGPNTWTGVATLGLTTTTITAALFAFDRSMVSGHFRVQGDSYCETMGLFTRQRSRLTSAAAVAARVGVSLTIAMTLAVPVLLKYFEGDIAQALAEENRSLNSALIMDVSNRVDAISASNMAAAKRATDATAADIAERNALLARTVTMSPTDQEEKRKLVQVHKLAAENARLQADAEAADMAAEKEGQKLKPSHTGIRTEGPAYRYHSDRRDQLLAVAAREDAEATATENDLAQEIAKASKLSSEEERNVQTRLDALARKIELDRAEMEKVQSEGETLANDRMIWINEQAALSPSYVKLDTGLLKRMITLGQIIAANAFTASFVAAVKLFIMALESLGPLAAWFFLRPGIYSMRVALRVREETEYESDRRRLAQRARARADRQFQTEQYRYQAKESAQKAAFEEFQNRFEDVANAGRPDRTEEGPRRVQAIT